MNDNPPNVNFARSQMVFTYVTRDPELNNLLTAPSVPVYNKKGEGFLFPPEIIEIVSTIAAQGRDAASATKNEILDVARSILQGAAVAEPEAAEPAPEGDEAGDEAAEPAPTPPPPPPRPAPPRAPVAPRPATPPPPRVAPAQPAAATAPRPAAPTPPKAPALVPAKVAAPAAPAAPKVTDRVDGTQAPIVVFALLTAASLLAKHDTTAGAPERLMRLEALAKEYGPGA
jgi:outer membrane biosynthesis protein TonB